jgi:hypothetical protein
MLGRQLHGPRDHPRPPPGRRRNKGEGTNTMGQRCSQQQLSIPFRFFSCAPVSEKS